MLKNVPILRLALTLLQGFKALYLATLRFLNLLLNQNFFLDLVLSKLALEAGDELLELLVLLELPLGFPFL